MTIYLDTSELNWFAKHAPDTRKRARTSNSLEALSGADALITPLNSPPPRTLALLAQHINAGALLVQRKSGADFPQSFGEHLDCQVDKLRAAAPRVCQRVVLYTGHFEKSIEDGKTWVGVRTYQRKRRATTPTIRWRKCHTRWDFWTLAYTKLMDRGQVRFEWLASDGWVDKWFADKERHIDEYTHKLAKDVYVECTHPHDAPDPADPLQLMRVVRDWRIAIACVPGFGPDTIESVRESCDDLGYVALAALTDPQTARKKLIRGVGAGLVARFRDFWQLPEGVRLDTRDIE